jgi:hypothetical protein
VSSHTLLDHSSTEHRHRLSEVCDEGAVGDGGASATFVKLSGLSLPSGRFMTIPVWVRALFRVIVSRRWRCPITRRSRSAAPSQGVVASVELELDRARFVTRPHGRRAWLREGRCTLDAQREHEYEARAAVSTDQLIVTVEVTTITPNYGQLEPIVRAAVGDLPQAGVLGRPRRCSRTPVTGTPNRWSGSSPSGA